MKVSVVTACRNSEKTIQDTIDSVLSQTFRGIEHVIKDGDSKDSTPDIIKKNADRYDGRLVWCSAPDKGIYDAMNTGITMSTGDVVGILNSDDFFTSSDVIEQVVNAFEEDPGLDAVYGDVHFVRSGAESKCIRYYSSRLFKPWMFRLGFMPAHPSFYCRKEIFEKFGLYDLSFRTSSDFEMLLRLVRINRIKTKYLDMDFVTMRLGGESTDGLSSKKRVNRDIAGALDKHNIYSNQLFQSLRYLWRIGELIYTKIRY